MYWFIGASVAIIPVLLLTNHYLFNGSLIKRFGQYLIVNMLLVSWLSFIVGLFGVIHLVWSAPLAMVMVGLTFRDIKLEIKKPIDAVVLVLELLSKGKTEHGVAQKLKRRKNELGNMMRVLEHFVDKQKETANFASQIGEGQLNVAYQALSEEDRLGISLLSMRDSLRDILDETNLVVRAAIEEGNLDSRVNEKVNQGAWKDLALSINGLLRTISEPVMKVTQVVDAMSKGDLTQRYDQEAKGQIAVLTEGLNLALDNINALLHDISSVVVRVSDSASDIKNTTTNVANTTSEIASSSSQLSDAMMKYKGKAKELDGMAVLLKEELDKFTLCESSHRVV